MYSIPKQGNGERQRKPILRISKMVLWYEWALDTGEWLKLQDLNIRVVLHFSFIQNIVFIQNLIVKIFNIVIFTYKITYFIPLEI